MDAFSPSIALPARPTDRAAPSSIARTADRIAWVALAMVSVFAALTFRDYGLGWDDYTHAQYGDLLLSLYSSGFHDTRALHFVNLYLYGGGFDMAAALLAKIVPLDLFETRRLLGAIIGVAGLAITCRIGRRVGGPIAGLVALLLLAACPLYIGHMFMNPKDAPFAVAMALFLLGFVRLLEEYPRPSASTVAIVGLGFGLSIGSRIMAGFGLIGAVLAFVFLFVVEARADGVRPAARRVGTLLVALIPAAILAYAVMALIWPWGVENPFNPAFAVEIFSHFFEKPWRELFDGSLLEPQQMPRNYALTLLGLKLPEFLTVTGVSGLGLLLFDTFRSAAAPRNRAVYLAVALAAILPVATTVATRPAMYNGIRHFVFVLPPLAVAGGFAIAWLATRANRLGRAVLAAILAIGLAVPAVGMAQLHPYEYTYFNNVAGGARGAQPRFMLDYWGLAFKQAGEELREKLAAQGITPPRGRKWRIAVCGPHPPARVALGDNFSEPSWDPKDADFALMLGTFYCAKLDAPLLVDVVRDGISFARAYDLRGRSIPSLFTYPPVKTD